MKTASNYTFKKENVFFCDQRLAFSEVWNGLYWMTNLSSSSMLSLVRNCSREIRTILKSWSLGKKKEIFMGKYLRNQVRQLRGSVYREGRACIFSRKIMALTWFHNCQVFAPISLGRICLLLGHVKLFIYFFCCIFFLFVNWKGDVQPFTSCWRKFWNSGNKHFLDFLIALKQNGDQLLFLLCPYFLGTLRCPLF